MVKYIRLENSNGDKYMPIYNPIKRVVIIPSQMGGTVSLDELPNNAGGNKENGNGIAPLARGMELLNVICANVAMTQGVVNATQNLNLNKLSEIERRVKKIEQMVRSIAMASAVRYGGTAGGGSAAGGGTVAPPAQVGEPVPSRSAVLGACPRTLLGLWDEYQNGEGGRKAVRKFTRTERGQHNVKFKYSMRRIVWKCIERLVDIGNRMGILGFGRWCGYFNIHTFFTSGRPC